MARPGRGYVPKSTFKKGTVKRLLKYLFSNYSFRLSVVTICIVLNAVTSIFTTIMLRSLIDDVIVPGLSIGFNGISGKLFSIILMLICIYVVGILCSFLQNFIMAEVSQGTLRNLRNEMFDKMESLPIKFFDKHQRGDIMSTFTNDTDAIRELIGRSLPQLIQSALSIVTVLSMMLSYSIWLTGVVVFFLFISLKATKKIGGNAGKFMLAQQKSLASEEGFVEEMLEGQKVIKVFCLQDKSKNDFDKLNEKLCNDSNTAHKLSNVIGPVTANIGNMLYVFVAICGTLMIHANTTNLSLTGWGTMTVGIIVSFLTMSRSASQTIGHVAQQIGMVTMGLAGASRVFEIMDQEPEKDDGYVTLVHAKLNDDGTVTESDKPTGIWAWKHPHKADGSITYTILKGDVVMENVDFGYEPDKEVLHDISLYAKPGQKIAFVGATGAGKTTITNLINRFYDVPEGKIRYDGININKIRKPDLRRSLGIVLQDVNLFSGTVLDNIRYGRLDATDEECINAAKLANADSFITRLPDGYNTVLTGNGSNLSQGQRQLISIARAAVANPPVMILDEATSSIDTRTEALVQKGMDNLMQGRTVFVIAHRLSTVRNSDAIMVLDHGKIIERGDHDTLLAQKGTYWQLYTGAFELE